MALGSLESRFMAVLWEPGRPLDVRKVPDALNSGCSPQLAYTTVLKVLRRLAGAGALARSERGRGHAYPPAMADESAPAVASVLRTNGHAAAARPIDPAGADRDLREWLRELAEGGI